MNKLNFLKDAPILAGISEEDRHELDKICQSREIKIHERLFSRNENAATFYIIIKGKFSLTLVITAAGKQEEIVIDIKTTGESLGWSAMVEPHRYIYSVNSLLEGTVLAFSGPEMLELFNSNKELGFKFYRNLNNLIGGRVHILQGLLIEEIEGSMDRVKYWLKKKYVYK